MSKNENRYDLPNLDDNVTKSLKEKISYWHEDEYRIENAGEIIDLLSVLLGFRNYCMIGRGETFKDERGSFFTVNELKMLGLNVIPLTQPYDDGGGIQTITHHWHIFTNNYSVEKVKKSIKIFENRCKSPDDENTEEEMLLGKLLGYPECCIQRDFKKDKGYKFPFAPHISCGIDCTESKIINNKIKGFLLQIEQEELVDFCEKFWKKKQGIKNREEHAETRG
ncbi:MAG: hypothetical protein KJ886_02700 [Candidatus Thermoplasmatota archaeon]|nr:hypothetical protein [Candidatus Thermoplasmatota archaeon]MBU4256545.1 hypothetical protein [Candidatus Thermoplasmatota archaeon]